MNERNEQQAQPLPLGHLAPTIFAGALKDAEWESLVRRRRISITRLAAPASLRWSGATRSAGVTTQRRQVWLDGNEPLRCHSVIEAMESDHPAEDPRFKRQSLARTGRKKGR